MPLETPALESWFNRHEAGSSHSLGMTMVQAFDGPDLAAFLPEGFGAAALEFGYAPTPGSLTTRSLIASELGVEADRVVLCAGATEANHTALRALVAPGDRVVRQDPIYYAFPNLLADQGARVVPWTVPADPTQAPDIDALLELILPDTRLVVLNTPHNPTGRQLTRRDLERLVAHVETLSDTLILIDEIYRPAGAPSALGLSPRVLVSDAVSKRWSLPGLRLGWLASTGPALEACRPYHEHATCCVSRPSEVIVEALWPRRQALWDANAAIAERNRARFASWLAEQSDVIHGVLPLAGVMTLLTPRARRSAVDDVALATALRHDHGVFVLPGSTLGYPGSLRVGFGHRRAQDLDAALRALALGLRANASSWSAG